MAGPIVRYVLKKIDEEFMFLWDANKEGWNYRRGLKGCIGRSFFHSRFPGQQLARHEFRRWAIGVSANFLEHDGDQDF